MEESTTYQLILESGFKLGEKKGEKEGEKTGITRGTLQEAKRFILQLGKKKFGPPNVATKAAITAIMDHKRLKSLGERIIDVSSWHELLA